MTIPEACNLWIEQRVQEELEANPDNPNLSKIGRDVAKEIHRLFETRVKPDTIRKRAARTNVQMKQPAEPPTENTKSNEIKQPAKDGTMRGGARPGAGRKPKNPESKETRCPERENESMSDEFKKSWEAMFTQLKNEKHLGWKTTSQATAVKYINILFDVATTK